MTPPTAGDQNADLVRVADQLESAMPSLVERQRSALHHFASYRRVPEEDQRRSCERNVVRVVSSIRGSQQLPAWIEEDERASGRRRALQGIPSDDVVAAYRAVLVVLRDAFLDEAAAAGIPLETVLLGTRRLWELTDRFSGELVSARHQVDLDLVRRHERERLTFLHNVLTGTLQADELEEGGAAYGISVEHTYWVLRGRPGSGTGPEALLGELERVSSSTAQSALLGLVGGDIAGVLRHRPRRLGGPGLLAIEGPVPMAGLSAAFAEATRMLDTAARFSLAGVVDQASLSLRTAVAQQHRLGESLFERYVTGVHGGTSMADIVLDSVRSYLDHQRSIPATARALSVHVNTLRYRLERYQAITGADLAETLTAFEVWWALQYGLIRPRAAGKTGPG